MTIIMPWVLGAYAFEQRLCFSRALEPKQALPQMGADILILRIAFERAGVALEGLLKLPLLKVNVTQLKMMMGFVQMMNLGLELLDAAAVVTTENPSWHRMRRLADKSEKNKAAHSTLDR